MENSWKAFSLKSRSEKRMKKLDIKYNKSRLEPALFGQRAIELRLQMKELETKH